MVKKTTSRIEKKTTKRNELSRLVELCYSEKGRRCGESHPKAKMTDAEVDICFDLHDKGFGTRMIHRITGFPRSTICDVLTCRTRSQPKGKVKRVAILVLQREDDKD